MTISKPFNPEMLALARRSRQISQVDLAKAAGTTGSLISQYENGSAPMTEQMVKRLAEVLDYPLSFFTRVSAFAGLAGGAIFHRKQQRLPAKTLYRAHAYAEIRHLEVATMLETLGTDFPPLPEYPIELLPRTPEEIARAVRSEMRVPPGPIFDITKTLEDNGCVVVAHDFKSRQIDGFSQRTASGQWFIHINADQPPDRWRWTLAHELGHAVMHSDPMAEPKEVEDQANLFAGEFLMPEREIRHALQRLTFQKLGGLKRKWKVSMQALIMRAHVLKTITTRQQTSMFTQLSRAGYRKREPAILDPPVEKPHLLVDLARQCLVEADYSVEELREAISINDTEFRQYYVDEDDIVAALGIDELL